MEFNKKQPALLYLDKNGFYFYVEGLPNIVSLAFLATSVKDMDVINGTSIMSQIKSFIEQYSIPPSTITIVLSPNVTFEKDIIGLTPEAQEEQVKNFTDTIPFESVLSKQYPIEKGVKVIGSNEELYLELKISFEKCSFAIDHVIPYQLLGNEQPLIQNLTLENASQFLHHIDRLKQFTMLTVPTKAQGATIQQNTKELKPKPNRTRLYAMAAVFLVLFGILAYMLLKK